MEVQRLACFDAKSYFQQATTITALKAVAALMQEQHEDETCCILDF